MGRSKSQAQESENHTRTQVRPKKRKTTNQRTSRNTRLNSRGGSAAEHEKIHDQHLPPSRLPRTYPGPMLVDLDGSIPVHRDPPLLVPSDADTEEEGEEEVVALVPDSILQFPVLAPSHAVTGDSEQADEERLSEFDPSNNIEDAILLDQAMKFSIVDNQYVEHIRAAARSRSVDLDAEAHAVELPASEDVPTVGFGVYVEGLDTPPLSPQSDALESVEHTPKRSGPQSESDQELEAPFGHKTFHGTRQVGYGLLDINTQCPTMSPAGAPSQITPAHIFEAEAEAAEYESSPPTDHEVKAISSKNTQQTSMSRRTRHCLGTPRRNVHIQNSGRRTGPAGIPRSNMLTESQRSNVKIPSSSRANVQSRTTMSTLPTGGIRRPIIERDFMNRTLPNTTPNRFRGKENSLPNVLRPAADRSPVATDSQRSNVNSGRPGRTSAESQTPQSSRPATTPRNSGGHTKHTYGTNVPIGRNSSLQPNTIAQRSSVPTVNQERTQPIATPRVSNAPLGPQNSNVPGPRNSTSAKESQRQSLPPPRRSNGPIETSRSSLNQSPAQVQTVRAAAQHGPSGKNSGSLTRDQVISQLHSTGRIHPLVNDESKHTIVPPRVVETQASREGTCVTRKGSNRSVGPQHQNNVSQGRSPKEEDTQLDSPTSGPDDERVLPEAENTNVQRPSSAHECRRADMRPAELARVRERNRLRKRTQRARKREEAFLKGNGGVDKAAIGVRPKPELKLFEGETSGAFLQSNVMTTLSKIVPTVVPCFRPVKQITLEELEKIHTQLKSKYSNGSQLLPTWTRRAVSRLVQSRRTRTRRKVERYLWALATRRRNSKRPDLPAGVFATELEFFTKQLASEEFKKLQEHMKAMSREMVHKRGCGNPLGSGGVERTKAHYTMEAAQAPTIEQVRDWKAKAVKRYEAGTSRTAVERRAQGIIPSVEEDVGNDVRADEGEVTKKRRNGKALAEEEDGSSSAFEDSGEEESSHADEEAEERNRVLAERAASQLEMMSSDWNDIFHGPELFRRRYVFLFGKAPTARELIAWQEAGQPHLN